MIAAQQLEPNLKARPEWKRHDFVKRLAIKRQLRRAGHDVPEQIMYDLASLRSLRRRLLTDAA